MHGWNLNARRREGSYRGGAELTQYAAYRLVDSIATSIHMVRTIPTA